MALLKDVGEGSNRAQAQGTARWPRDFDAQCSKMATARVQPALAPRILWGKQLIVKP